MPLGLDHLIHAVHHLDAAAALYRSLGFTVGARNRHPWGTHNAIVQFPGVFIELLTMAEPGKLGVGGLSEHFGRGTQHFLERGEGLSFIVLESADVAADAAKYNAAGIGTTGPLPFEREGSRPDGSKVRIGFTLAFVRDSHAPEVGFAVCKHRYPENFWNPAFQRHTNGASSIAGVVLVAENPSDHHIFLSAFTGERELLATSSGVAASTPRGAVQIMDPAAFENHFGIAPPDLAAGPVFAALRFGVRDPSAPVAALSAGGIPFSSHMGRTVVEPGTAMGATLVFEPA